MNAPRFTAPSFPWWSPIKIPTEVDVPWLVLGWVITRKDRTLAKLYSQYSREIMGKQTDRVIVGEGQHLNHLNHLQPLNFRSSVNYVLTISPGGA